MVTTLPIEETLPTTLTTVDEFEAWERQHHYEGSYEFVRGQIIKKESMKQNEAFISSFLVRKFIYTQAFSESHVLLPELDSYVDGTRKRVPDLTYFTADQMAQMRSGIRVKTLFAIEILSDSESHEDVLDKIQDYFDGGAQLVWYIAPKRQKIYVYTSPDESKAFKGADLLSASPVIPDFQFKVQELFA